MTDKVVPIKKGLMDMASEVVKHHPNADGFIIVAFDDTKTGEMHTYYKANDYQMSLASTRLSHLANN